MVWVEFGYTEEEKEKQEAFIEKCKSEKDMKAPDITKILLKQFEKDGYLTNTERHAGSIDSTLPLDIIVGKIEQDNYYGDEITIVGLEVKSDRDTFTRLQNQLRDYSKYCNEVFLVVHHKDPPKWLSSDVGVIRVSKNGDMFIEKHAYTLYQEQTLSEVCTSTNAEFVALMTYCGMGKNYGTLDTMFKIVPKIWRKIIFNRFFGDMDYSSTPKYDKCFPFDKQETEFIIGNQLEWQINFMEKKVREMKKMVIATENYLKSLNKSEKQKDLTKLPKDSDTVKPNR